MAEVLARHLSRSLPQLQFSSAGLFANPGAPATEQARKAVEERGLDLSGHRARQLTPDLVSEADVLVGLTGSHVQLMQEQFPEAGRKIRSLHSFTAEPDRDVADPFGGNLDSYRKTRDEIESALSDLLLTVISPMKKQQEEL